MAIKMSVVFGDSPEGPTVMIDGHTVKPKTAPAVPDPTAPRDNDDDGFWYTDAGRAMLNGK